LDKECIDRTKSAVERVAMAGAKVILTGSLAIGLLLPEYGVPLIRRTSLLWRPW
jgi:hypothetical protein